MASPVFEEEGILQEWAPESKLLDQIPNRVQKGFFPQPLQLTCLDVSPDNIALGTNCGLVYWYDRRKGHLDRLRVENGSTSITTVGMVNTVDYMVAAGSDTGVITIFQIPKLLPENYVFEEEKPTKRCSSNKIERFTINDLHQHAVTCVQWSHNGMKLFSGDKSGRVVLTSVDFHLHLTKSQLLLNEKFEVVQLSYNKQVLLVSTLYRTLLCDGANSWKITQVGSRDRKILGKFGATFCHFDHGEIIYSSRPGFRLWLANCQGSVQQTLIFKDAVSLSKPAISSIPILNETLLNNKAENFVVFSSSALGFGKLLQFANDKLIAFDEHRLYIIHPGAIRIVAKLNLIRIRDVAATANGEIFVLTSERSLLRIASFPNPLAIDVSTRCKEQNKEKRKSFHLDLLAGMIKDTAVESFKRITSEVITQAEKISPASLADETSQLILPPIVSLTTNHDCQTIPDLNVEEHVPIDDDKTLKGNSDDDAAAAATAAAAAAEGREKKEVEEEVIARPVKRHKFQKRPKTLKNKSECSESELYCPNNKSSNVNCSRLETGIVIDSCISEESPTQTYTDTTMSSFSMLKDFIRNPSPDDCDEKSVDTCESASENMPVTPERFLKQQELVFQKLANQEHSMVDSFASDRTENMSISIHLTTSSSVGSSISVSSDVSDRSISMISDDHHRRAIEEFPASSSSNSQNNLIHNGKIDEGQFADDTSDKEMILSRILGIDLNDPLKDLQDKMESEWNSICDNNEDVYRHQPNQAPFTNYKKDEEDAAAYSLRQKPVLELEEQEKNVIVDPLISYGPPSGSSLLSSCHPSLEINHIESASMLLSQQAETIEKSDRWLLYKSPDSLSTLSVCDNYVVCTDKYDRVFASPLTDISLNWTEMEYKAKKVSMSLNGQRVRFLSHERRVFAVVNPSQRGPFSETLKELVSMSQVKSLDVDENAVYVVDNDGQIKIYHHGDDQVENGSISSPIEDVSCCGNRILVLTSNGQLFYKTETDGEFHSISKIPCELVTSIHLDCRGLIWIVDDRNHIYFSDDFGLNWWQILISEYIFRNPVSLFEDVHTRMKAMPMLMQIKQTHVASNSKSLWVHHKFSSVVHVNKTDVNGYRWIPIQIKVGGIKFRQLCAEGVFEDQGHLWLLSCEGDLFYANPRSPGQLYSVPSPRVSSSSDFVGVAATPSSVWAWTADGNVFAQSSVDLGSPGIQWRHIPMQEDLWPRHISWLALGSEIIWAVDDLANVYFTIGSPSALAEGVTGVVWTPLDDSLKVEKIFVGPNEHMVWATDRGGRIYVREGIFPYVPMGTGWVQVQGTLARYLSVSASAVYAVAPKSGILLRRYGVTQNNYIGDYWRQLPAPRYNHSDKMALSCLSASFCDQLWGLSSDQKVILKLLKRNIVLSKYEDCASKNYEDSSFNHDEWEVVH